MPTREDHLKICQNQLLAYAKARSEINPVIWKCHSLPDNFEAISFNAELEKLIIEIESYDQCPFLVKLWRRFISEPEIEEKRAYLNYLLSLVAIEQLETGKPELIDYERFFIKLANQLSFRWKLKNIIRSLAIIAQNYLEVWQGGDMFGWKNEKQKQGNSKQENSHEQRLEIIGFQAEKFEQFNEELKKELKTLQQKHISVDFDNSIAVKEYIDDLQNLIKNFKDKIEKGEMLPPQKKLSIASGLMAEARGLWKKRQDRFFADFSLMVEVELLNDAERWLDEKVERIVFDAKADKINLKQHQLVKLVLNFQLFGDEIKNKNLVLLDNLVSNFFFKNYNEKLQQKAARLKKELEIWWRDEFDKGHIDFLNKAKKACLNYIEQVKQLSAENQLQLSEAFELVEDKFNDQLEQLKQVYEENFGEEIVRMRWYGELLKLEDTYYDLGSQIFDKKAREIDKFGCALSRVECKVFQSKAQTCLVDWRKKQPRLRSFEDLIVPIDSYNFTRLDKYDLLTAKDHYYNDLCALKRVYLGISRVLLFYRDQLIEEEVIKELADNYNKELQSIYRKLAIKYHVDKYPKELYSGEFISFIEYCFKAIKPLFDLFDASLKNQQINRIDIGCHINALIERASSDLAQEQVKRQNNNSYSDGSSPTRQTIKIAPKPIK